MGSARVVALYAAVLALQALVFAHARPTSIPQELESVYERVGDLLPRVMVAQKLTLWWKSINGQDRSVDVMSIHEHIEERAKQARLATNVDITRD